MPESIECEVIPSNSVQIWVYQDAPDALKSEFDIHLATEVQFLAYVPAHLTETGVCNTLPHKVRFQAGDGSELLYW
jgi:hypothetical protein